MTIAFPFGLGNFQSTTGLVILLSALVGSFLTALTMTMFWAIRRARPDLDDTVEAKAPRTSDRRRTAAPRLRGEDRRRPEPGRPLVLTLSDDPTRLWPRVDSVNGDRPTANPRPLARPGGPRPDRLRRVRTRSPRGRRRSASLKASVSQLEFENEKLRKEVGELKADNSRLDNQLAQEREANGEITARLDDAKDLLRRQGGNAQALGGSSKDFEDDGIPPPVATPQGPTDQEQPDPARRPASPSSPSPSDSTATTSATSRPAGPLATSAPTTGDDDRWLPVARGLSSQVPVRK